jgi:hypothetical protein
MSILSSPSPASIPAGHIEAVCVGCNAAIEIPAGGPIPRCTACQRSDAEAEAAKLLADARDLRNGTGVFSGLTADERHEQLSALILSSDDGRHRASTIQESISGFVEMLDDAGVDFLADLVSRKLGDRNRKPVASGTPTLVRVAIADLSDTALIDLIGTNDEPILLNAASLELSRRLGSQSDSYALPLFSQEPGAEPDSATRFELEGKIESDGLHCADEHPLAGSFDADFAA